MILVEARQQTGNVHLWARTLPSSVRFRSLCGVERHKNSLNTWGLVDRNRCTECAVMAGVIAANGVDVEVVSS